ncbi:PREDICTED: uncharacterized protein LOC100641518 isoform X2 [Amphimedon queenslandica]|uniref:G domain-containing protein n=1 Tax=Amphimedon queenslandica TaxID=400682 RepID=A0A1X7U656_AMPQE|nr:PREDICTED: uncharacterized protein LOC100641518 isoform X2 [Amphimedon queenslandica]XP_019855985.1 PREDICTED: uncharacterized protein LOC100641518 isoform X2 [Amphimedon queenslandica]XP_019855986.1 PREDICTED: uncharacterized protein LOC100641518 isoform X2 [Amphimedon queenslandica]|eukprot:XP_003388904.1 PREDICTED: uncharacterized protein LOC100641518 isoform X2 [Amphimedon queenslandica]
MAAAKSRRANKQQQQRAAANTAESISMTTNEKILKECHDLYVTEKNGLIALGKEVDYPLVPPRKKITVLLIGNHSAGKSSFINWYIEEHVQKTAVAIETQGFSIVTSGKKRESLTGNATLHLFPQFRELSEINGVVDYLSTEVATSKQKRFPFVTFIDTPGLVDGDMKYPFDVEKTLIWLGEMADLVFVFFDPLGQALCRRTLDIVECLNAKHPERIKFYLSKADTAGTQGDRQRVLMQITQELCKRQGLNRAGFDMPTIFIPSLTEKTTCDNHIDEVCETITKTIDRNIQNTLNTLEKDAATISSLFHDKLNKDKETNQLNMKARCRSFIVWFFALLFPAIYAYYAAKNWDSVDKINMSDLYYLLGFSLISLIIFVIGCKMYRIKRAMSKKERARVQEIIAYIDNTVKTKKSSSYQDYLSQSVSGIDMLNEKY